MKIYKLLSLFYLLFFLMHAFPPALYAGPEKPASKPVAGTSGQQGGATQHIDDTDGILVDKVDALSLSGSSSGKFHDTPSESSMNSQVVVNEKSVEDAVLVTDGGGATGSTDKATSLPSSEEVVQKSVPSIPAGSDGYHFTKKEDRDPYAYLMPGTTCCRAHSPGMHGSHKTGGMAVSSLSGAERGHVHDLSSPQRYQGALGSLLQKLKKQEGDDMHSSYLSKRKHNTIRATRATVTSKGLLSEKKGSDVYSSYSSKRNHKTGCKASEYEAQAYKNSRLSEPERGNFTNPLPVGSLALGSTKKERKGASSSHPPEFQTPYEKKAHQLHQVPAEQRIDIEYTEHIEQFKRKYGRKAHPSLQGHATKRTVMVSSNAALVTTTTGKRITRAKLPAHPALDSYAAYGEAIIDDDGNIYLPVNAVDGEDVSGSLVKYMKNTGNRYKIDQSFSVQSPWLSEKEASALTASAPLISGIVVDGIIWLLTVDQAGFHLRGINSMDGSDVPEINQDYEANPASKRTLKHVGNTVDFEFESSEGEVSRFSYSAQGAVLEQRTISIQGNGGSHHQQIESSKGEVSRFNYSPQEAFLSNEPTSIQGDGGLYHLTSSLKVSLMKRDRSIACFKVVDPEK